MLNKIPNKIFLLKPAVLLKLLSAQIANLTRQLFFIRSHFKKIGLRGSLCKILLDVANLPILYRGAFSTKLTSSYYSISVLLYVGPESGDENCISVLRTKS